MAEDWLKDVRIYDADADEGVVASIVKYCGIALQSRDSSLVAMSDPKEVELVRENYLKKKLGLTDSDESLTASILSVGQVMKADRTKNRVTVYYLLAKHYGLMNIFGGVAGAAGAAAAVSGLMGSADKAEDDGASVAPLAAAGLAGAGISAAAAIPDSEPLPEPEPEAAAPAYAAGNYDEDVAATGGGMGWLKWLLLALLLAALLFFLLRSCSKPEAMAPAEPAATAAAPATDAVAPAPAAEAKIEAAPATAAPQGSGVVASTKDGKPMLTVYFDQAKTNVPADFDKVAAVIKDYAAKNPGAKFAVSGFNSPTGSAAGNARLSKGRAENVGAALQKLGVAAGAVELIKPADATQGQGEDAQARRVEVTVK
jgi:outer membrane protein OmpA-like peptidoglycan-associated protein